MKKISFSLAIIILASCSPKLTPAQKARKAYIKEAAKCCPIVIEPKRKS